MNNIDLVYIIIMTINNNIGLIYIIIKSENSYY